MDLESCRRRRAFSSLDESGSLGRKYRYSEGRTNAERFRYGVRVLWSIYSGPRYSAVLELWMAARTDAELRDHLNLVAERHGVLAAEAVNRFFPLLEEASAIALIETVHTALVGMLMQRSRDISHIVFVRVLAMLDDLVELHLEKAKRGPVARDPRKRRTARRVRK